MNSLWLCYEFTYKSHLNHCSFTVISLWIHSSPKYHKKNTNFLLEAWANIEYRCEQVVTYMTGCAPKFAHHPPWCWFSGTPRLVCFKKKWGCVWPVIRFQKLRRPRGETKNNDFIWELYRNKINISEIIKN